MTTTDPREGDLSTAQLAHAGEESRELPAYQSQPTDPAGPAPAAEPAGPASTADRAGPDLSGTDLSGTDLPGTDRAGADPTGADPAGQALVRSHEDGAEPPAQLFGPDDLEGIVDRWRDIQASFVDEPRKAVKDADALVAEMMQQLARMFASQREQLEGSWSAGDSVSTEDLRQGLQRYRSFFERLLAA